MIIKIIPEENEHIKPVEHTNVKEFFIFGNKKDEENTSIDFHDWSGQYRYLLGSLTYFQELIRMEMNSDNSESKNIPSQLPPKFIADGNKQSKKDKENKDGMIKQVAANSPDLKIITKSDIETEEANEEVKNREEANKSEQGEQYE